MNPAASPASSRIVELDALRGLAALAVVLFHYTTRYAQLYGHGGPLPFAVPWGHFGVEIFFAISGFVIFMSLERTRALRGFAVSRFARLFPAYWAAIGLTTLVVAAAGLAELQQPAGVVLLNLAMAHSLFQVPSVDGVYWTLSIELCFYVIMAALWRLGLLRAIEPVLIGWLALKWAWTFAPAVAGIALPHVVGTLLIQAYIPYFAIGIAGYRLMARPAAPASSLAVMAAAVLTVGACDGPAYLPVALLASAAVVAVTRGGLAPLRWRVLRWLGTVSYSLYLLHQYIGYAALRGLASIGVPPTIAIVLTLGIAIALAAAVTHAVERPGLRWIRGRGRARAGQEQAGAALRAG